MWSFLVLKYFSNNDEIRIAAGKMQENTGIPLKACVHKDELTQVKIFHDFSFHFL